MQQKSYGVVARSAAASDHEAHVEEIRNRGYTVLPDVLSYDELSGWRKRIDLTYAKQEQEFGRDRLVAIKELDLCRAPLLYDRDFLGLAEHPKIMEIVRALLGEWFILNLQNAIINRPNIEHHQSSWHRDLPYQNFVISRPLSVNALFAIDDFSAQTGGTQFLPFSHKIEYLPSEQYVAANRVHGEARAGSVILFDSMVFHRAGANSSPNIRRAINQMYTVPIVKQQYDFAKALASERSALSEGTLRLLGFTSEVPLNDREWRAARAAKLGIAG
ncbi:phytanoyl-CoA dioxygenase family protein [Rhizobium anhuiense]|uniref:phytanoyl-CoA dioxygenase family protein n=1 Tax=Rhizobium anhuiense TaxID=1184720 RepID=UPI000BEACC62|nr:phytanoyl-CoA dioxygenase family protein [Rhizobium anhuiense]PDS33805.1 phytanoyl-CoA dioxygenase family protein [Rhizobium anhuiense]